MKKISLFFLGFVTLSPAVFADGWTSNSIWKDGRAEVSIYESEKIMDGKPKKFREQILTVREELKESDLIRVSTTSKEKTIQVFKQNIVQQIETENESSSYLTSVFVKEKDPSQVVKISVGAQDWNGHAYKILKVLDKGGEASLDIQAYLPGDQNKAERLALLEEDLFEDQLALALRSLPMKVGFSKKVRLWESISNNHAIVPLVTEAIIEVQGEELIHCHAGAFPSIEIAVHRGNLTDTYWFEKATPNILTKMVTSDGRKRILYARARWSYWDHRLPMPNVLK